MDRRPELVAEHKILVGVRAWALRWLAQWASESRTATAERAAEVAASLADLPAEPTMLERLLAG